MRQPIIEGGILNISSIIVHPGPGQAEAVQARLAARAARDTVVEAPEPSRWTPRLIAALAILGLLGLELVWLLWGLVQTLFFS